MCFTHVSLVCFCDSFELYDVIPRSETRHLRPLTHTRAHVLLFLNVFYRHLMRRMASEGVFFFFPNSSQSLDVNLYTLHLWYYGHLQLFAVGYTPRQVGRFPPFPDLRLYSLIILNIYCVWQYCGLQGHIGPRGCQVPHVSTPDQSDMASNFQPY
ncbi:hypothetical protein Tb927.4.2610 [Trypanosoma brucei brucei TREU927]|uniref:Uncharacterized protein n=1 Tax=Trypanosoma brucei brucei (strain 927/4 GUTat10.1) TaxID=185431 RepID=Q584C6_TRYB2|nr:hypothetical protein Tb927.4.2610 [Trypanosoma brucei brucei TREU927]AAX79018.1 hypothetical protein Tb927.4.2610 [Trypanosoma brucei]AAZ10852.1 hypothetical protein Tb927.4.2610 [Trypanosoma brucei brucei TREU927]